MISGAEPWVGRRESIPYGTDVFGAKGKQYLSASRGRDELDFKGRGFVDLHNCSKIPGFQT